MASTAQGISDFASALERLEARWRKVPPVRVEWYKPPRRNTLPLLRYSVNPGKTMILKVAILPADSGGPALISVALFGIDGSFMFDTTFRLLDAEKATAWLRLLFADELIVEVTEKDATWAGSYCGRPKGQILRSDTAPAYTRSWLGKHDAV